ncbi:hypothetical protein A6R68_18471, partial [Neotoma lepida]
KGRSLTSPPCQSWKLEQSKSKTREISKRDLVVKSSFLRSRLPEREACSVSVPFGGQADFVVGTLDLYPLWPLAGAVSPGSAKALSHSAIMNPEDPTTGFRHGKVLKFINEQMSKHTKGPEFYTENLSLSWEEVEEKLKILLEDSEMSSGAREACAWSGLALGVRFAWRQGHLLGRRVQWLHDFASLQRSAAHVVAADLKKLTIQQEMERKESVFQLHLAHTKLAEVQRELDLMRLKLLHAELRAFPVAEIPVVTRAPAAAGRAQSKTKNAEEKEEVTANLSRSTTSPQPFTIQLPESFTYLYESPFPVTPTPSPPPNILTEPQMPPYFMATDMNVSDTEGPTVFLQEPPKGSQYSQLQGNMALQRLGDWDCPWCKAENFSGRENCFLCGKLIWLQNPQIATPMRILKDYGECQHQLQARTSVIVQPLYRTLA